MDINFFSKAASVVEALPKGSKLCSVLGITKEVFIGVMLSYGLPKWSYVWC